MKASGLNLLISDKPDVEREAVARAFQNAGGVVHRLARFWDPPQLDSSTVCVYGADTFCLVLEQKLSLALCSPSNELILQVPPRFLNRRISCRRLGDVSTLDFPAFVKPASPKQFAASVYETGAALASECSGLPPETLILASEPVAFASEVRAFLVNGIALDAAVYEGTAEVGEAIDFVEALSKSMRLPRAIVVDVGFISSRGWSVIEFNAAWGAGLNGCDAEKVLPAIVSASGRALIE